MVDEPKFRWEFYKHRLVKLQADSDGYGAWVCACGTGASGYRWTWDPRGVELCMANEWGEHVRDSEVVPSDA